MILTDHNYESRLSPIMSLNIYVPKDENFGHLKMSDFLGYSLKALSISIKPGLQAIFDSTPNEFDKFKEVDDLFERGFPIPFNAFKTLTEDLTPPLFKALVRNDGEKFLKFPTPQVVKGKILDFFLIIKRFVMY